VNRTQQVFLPERFGKEVDRARLDRSHRSRYVAVSCDEHDWRVVPLRDLTLQVQSVDVRKLDIENQTSLYVWLRVRDVLGSCTKRNRAQIKGRKKLA